MPEEISLAEYLRLQKPRNKFFARKTEVNGIWFDSMREAQHYRELLIRERMGEIKNLKLQPEFPIVVNEQKICTYVADFSFLDVKTGEPVVEDVKGVKTPLYKLKKKLFRALYGREIVEIL